MNQHCLYLTKQQIESFVNRVGQPEASILLNNFFKSYRKHLSSRDVSNLYDAAYLAKVESHGATLLVNNKFRINIYNKYSYDYLISRITTTSRVIDVGCGSGDFALSIAIQKVKDVVGLDFSFQAIKEATRKMKESELKNCTFICGEIADLKIDGLFDYVVLNDIIEHLSDKELNHLFSKINKLLTDTGEIIIHTPNGLALCNDTDSNLIQKSLKFYQRVVAGWRGHERSIDQLYYDQVHINIKSYSKFKKFLKQLNFESDVYYDEKSRFPFLSQLSSNMLIVAKKLRRKVKRKR